MQFGIDTVIARAGEYLHALVREGGIDDPEPRACALFLLMEGAIVTAYLENNPGSAATAKATAGALLRVKVTA